MATQMHFHVLGPLSVVADDQRVAVGGARQRTILALLLLSAGRVVSVDALVEAVWQGQPPATARTQVAICIGALRKSLKAAGCAEDTISTAHPGYLLNPDGHWLDLLEFESLRSAAESAAAAGDSAGAAELYRKALALWQLPVLPGVVGQPVEEEAARLEELRLTVLDDFAVLQLTLGQHQEVLPELVALVRDHPLRERSRHSLMLALYRTGRRAESMEVFREGRRHLVDELGLEPGPELQRLHDEVLRDDPGLTLAQPAPAAPAAVAAALAVAPAPADLRVVPSDLPPNVPAFSGRGDEIAQLDGLLEPRAEGRPPAVGFITGVPGVGKTGLAVHWAHSVADRFPDGRLYVDLCGHDGFNEPVAPAEVLGRFLRALGVPNEQIPEDVEERTSLYRSLLSDRRVLLLLDNVRSFAQVRRLLPAGSGSCVLVTSRDPQEQLVLRYGAVRVQLGMLPQDDAVELIGQIVSRSRLADDPDQVRQLVELCDRLPLALRIAAARLASKPHWTVRHLVTRLADERRRLDELSQGESQVRASFELSYRYLPGDTARLYRRLALLDVPDFTTWVGAALLDSETFEAERLLELLVDTQLLEVVGVDGVGQLRYRFHNLLRLFARERLQQEESKADCDSSLDRVVGTWLAVSDRAHALEHGGDFGNLTGDVVRRAPEPGAMGELLRQPLDWYQSERLALLSLVDQTARLGRHEQCWELASAMVMLFDVRNYIDDLVTCCERALAVCREAGNARGEAVMLSDLGAGLLRLGQLEEGTALLEESCTKLRQIGEKHGLGMTLRALGVAHHLHGDPESAERRLREARPLLTEVGDLLTEAHVLGYLAQLALDRGLTEEAVELAQEAVRLARRANPRNRATAQALNRLARAYLATDRLDSAERTFGEVAAITRSKRDQMGTGYALLGLGETRLRLGLVQEARQELLEGLELAERLHTPVLQGQLHLALGQVLRQLEGPGSALRHLLAAQDLFAEVSAARMFQRAEAAIAELRQARGSGRMADISRA